MVTGSNMAEVMRLDTHALAVFLLVAVRWLAALWHVPHAPLQAKLAPINLVSQIKQFSIPVGHAENPL